MLTFEAYRFLFRIYFEVYCLHQRDMNIILKNNKKIMHVNIYALNTILKSNKMTNKKTTKQNYY